MGAKLDWTDYYLGGPYENLSRMKTVISLILLPIKVHRHINAVNRRILQ